MGVKILKRERKENGMTVFLTYSDEDQEYEVAEAEMQGTWTPVECRAFKEKHEALEFFKKSV